MLTLEDVQHVGDGRHRSIGGGFLKISMLIFSLYQRLPMRALMIMGVFVFSGVAQAKSVSVEYVKAAPQDVSEAIKEALPEIVKPETPIHARRQGRRAKAIVKDTLNSFGYYNPNIVMSVADIEGGPAAVLSIDTGPLFTLATVQLKFADPQPRAKDAERLKREVPVASGDPAVPSNIIDAERVLGVLMRDMGYAFSDVDERNVIGDKEAATISVRYTINSGPRVLIGAVVFPDDIRTKDKYLARLDPTEIGELYDPGKLALYNSRLSETRLFSISQAQLSSEPSDVTPDGDYVHDIVLDIKERPQNTIGLGANYGTNEGFGVNAELTRRNLTRRGDLLIADVRIAQREMGLNLTWRRPNELGYGRGLVLTAAALDEDTDAFEQQILKLGAGYEVVRSEKLNYSFGIRGQYIRQKEETITQDFQTVSAYAGFNLDYSDSLLDPRRGWRAEGRVVPTYAFGGSSDQTYVRAVSQGRAYFPLDESARIVLAGRLRAGVLFGAEANEVPGDDRFYAGGGGSVRGYGYQAIGPFDAANTPLGGRSLIDSSFEARWRYNDKIGLVAFFDAGNVSNALYPKFDNLRVGAGIGARYMTPAGPIRVDIATPLNPSDRDDAFQIYISIGQAF